ncbi:MAG: DUF1552 domain-containing protein [Verrucomicrobiota bacterium]
MLVQTPTTRRHFVKAAGITIALPWFESLSAAAEPKAPMRGIFVSSPCGIVPDQWYPKGDGADFEFSRCLKPLEPFRDHLTVFRGLWHSKSPGGGHGGEALLLTGADPHADPSKDWSTTVSADQVLAKKIGVDTRFESMQLCGSQSGGFGTPQTISFSEEGVALEAEWRPGHIFDALFGDTRDVESKKVYHAQQRSILDLLHEDIGGLTPKLGKQDQEKLDEYLTSVRGIENRLEREQAWMDRPKPKPPIDAVPYDPNYKVADAPTHMETVFELLLAAMQTDSCRVFSYVIGNMGGGLWSSLGDGRDKHSISHHRGNKADIELLAQMDIEQSKRFANFLTKLKNTTEADGSSMLDNVVIFTGSGMQDANAHSGRDLPITLMGGGSVLKHGEVRRHEEGEISNVLLTVLQAMGVERENFGASNRVYSEISKG